MKARKPWREMLADSKGLPRISEATGKLSARWGQGTMVIPAPAEVDALIIARKGKRALVAEFEQALFTRLADAP